MRLRRFVKCRKKLASLREFDKKVIKKGLLLSCNSPFIFRIPILLQLKLL